MNLSSKIPPLVGVSLLAAGCQRAPSVDILGSFFPVWIFCAVIGVIAAALTRELFIRTKYDAVIKASRADLPVHCGYGCLSTLVDFFQVKRHDYR